MSSFLSSSNRYPSTTPIATPVKRTFCSVFEKTAEVVPTSSAVLTEAAIRDIVGRPWSFLAMNRRLIQQRQTVYKNKEGVLTYTEHEKNEIKEDLSIYFETDDIQESRNKSESVSNDQ